MSKNILVVFGGVSPEHDISIQSAKNVINSLGKHTAIPLYITREGKWLIYDGKHDNIEGINWEKYGTPAIISPDRSNRGLIRIVGERIKTILVDVVFPVLHGPYGEDGTIQGLCELSGLPYVGCGVAASAIGMDKSITKLIAKSLGIPQLGYMTVDYEDYLANKRDILKKIRYKVGYPCFVKANNGGSSIGVSKVMDRVMLDLAILEAFHLSPKVIVEKAANGREIEIGVLGNGFDAKLSACGEIIPGGEFYDFNEKYKNNTTQLIVPANLPDKVVEIIEAYALGLFASIGGKGLARVDFFVKEEKVYFSEINTIPGFTAISLYPRMWEASGVSRLELVEELIRLATVGESEKSCCCDRQP